METISSGGLAPWQNVICSGDGFKKNEGGCGAEMSIDKADLVAVRSWDAKLPHYYFVVKCPSCGSATKVKGVPRLLREELLTPEVMEKATPGDKDPIF